MKEIIIDLQPEEDLLGAHMHDAWLGRNALKARIKTDVPNLVADSDLAGAAEASRRRLQLATVTRSFEVPGSAIIPGVDGELVRFESLGNGQANMQSVDAKGQTSHLKTISRQQKDITVA